MTNDNTRKLYDALSKKYDMGSYEKFCADIEDETKRKKLYDATVTQYKFGDYDSFSRQLGFGTDESAPQFQQALSSAPLKVTDMRPTASQGGSAHTPMPDFNASIARLRQATDNARRALARTHGKIGNEADGIVSDDTVSRINEDAGIIAASRLGVNGSRYRLGGITPAPRPSGDESEAAQQSDNDKGNMGDLLGAVPYGAEVRDGEVVPRWVLSDGEATSDPMIADQAEYEASQARLKREFDNRMKQNGLDPGKPVDMCSFRPSTNASQPMRSV